MRFGQDITFSFTALLRIPHLSISCGSTSLLALMWQRSQRLQKCLSCKFVDCSVQTKTNWHYILIPDTYPSHSGAPNLETRCASLRPRRILPHSSHRGHTCVVIGARWENLRGDSIAYPVLFPLCIFFRFALVTDNPRVRRGCCVSITLISEL